MDDGSLVERMVSSARRYSGRIVSLRVDEVRLPSGVCSVREVVEHPGGVAVVAVDDDRRLVMVRQFRYAVGKALWEIPAGKLDPGEEPLECACRELEEETGYRARHLEKAAAFYTSPGFCDEILHLYIGTGLVPGNVSPDEDEMIQTVLVSRRDLDEMIREGTLRDGKTLLGVYLAVSRGLL